MASIGKQREEMALGRQEPVALRRLQDEAAWGRGGDPAEQARGALWGPTFPGARAPAWGQERPPRHSSQGHSVDGGRPGAGSGKPPVGSMQAHPSPTLDP